MSCNDSMRKGGLGFADIISISSRLSLVQALVPIAPLSLSSETLP